jgi:hypothetical protein
MTVRGLAVLVSVFAVVVSRSSVLLGFFVIAMIVFMGSLQVVVSCGLMMSSGRVMMLAGSVFLLFGHLNAPSSKEEVRSVAEQNALPGDPLRTFLIPTQRVALEAACRPAKRSRLDLGWSRILTKKKR